MIGRTDRAGNSPAPASTNTRTRAAPAAPNSPAAARETAAGSVGAGIHGFAEEFTAATPTAAQPRAGGPAAPRPSARSAGPHAAFQRTYGGGGAHAKPKAGKPPGKNAADTTARAEARKLASDPKTAAKDPGAAIDSIRTLPAKEQLAFAHAMLAEGSIPATDRAYMLFMLGATGADGMPAAVTFDDVVRGASPQTLASLQQVLAETGKSYYQDVAKKPLDEQKRLADYASDSVPLLAMLMPHLGKDALAHLVAKADTPEAREALGKALALAPPEFLGRLASKLDSKGLETAVNALVDLTGTPELRSRALADLVEGMKPKQRNAVFDKLETSSRWDPFLDAVGNPQILERILPSLTPANLAALNHGFEWTAANTPAGDGDSAKVARYREAANLVERYARNKAEHNPSFGKKYDRARDAYSDRDQATVSRSASSETVERARSPKDEPRKNSGGSKIEGSWKLGNKFWPDDWLAPP